jgi:hypothetical protein
MAIRPLTLDADIRYAFETMKTNVNLGGTVVHTVLGSGATSEEADVVWHEDIGLWTIMDADRVDGRYWCAFGTSDPNAAESVSITCEIQIPKTGLDLRHPGIFLRDSSSNAYLAHSGKIGGGFPGVGKLGFLNSGPDADILPVQLAAGRNAEYMLIGRIDDKRLIDEILKFVRKVEAFKIKVREERIRSKVAN